MMEESGMFFAPKKYKMKEKPKRGRKNAKKEEHVEEQEIKTKSKRGKKEISEEIETEPTKSEKSMKTWSMVHWYSTVIV